MEMTTTERAYGPETEQILQDLIRESLRLLLLATVALAWLWTVAVIHVAPARVAPAALVFTMLLGTCALAYRLQQQKLVPAVRLYLVSLFLAVLLITILFRSLPALYLFIMVVLAAATLTSPWATWGAALAAAVAALILSRSGLLGARADVSLPVILTLFAALSSWLASRRLFTALGWTLTITDEARKNAEQARKHRAEVRRVLKSLDEAYARLERANEALLFARAEAEKAYRFKAEFVANVSHELRTPLHLIVGFSEMVVTAPESYSGTPLPSEYRGDMMAIYRSARHLSELINDVLDLSQIEAGRLPLSREPAPLGGVIQEAVQLVRGLAEAKGLQVRVEVPEDLPPLPLDRTRIRQVLLNLLTNALRYTDTGQICVRAHLQEQQVQVTVEDTGRGIPADKLTRAFEAFSQLDEDRAREGSGLGLALSRKFVEMHGGRMWIESAMGQGTRVSFTLPGAEGRPGSAPALVQTGAPPGQTGVPGILVLHDDRRVVTSLQRYLEGYRMELAESVTQAGEMIRRNPPAAVIVDAGRAEGGAPLDLPPEMPLITCPLPSMRRLGLALGASDFLTKPVAREDLADALARLPRPPKTILIIDDNTRIVRLLARMVKAHNPEIHVLEAFGGRQGLDVARSQHPDLVLLDLSMPEFSGYDFLEEVARDPALADLQIIIVSVRAIEDEMAPIRGELRLQREAGLTMTQVLQALQAMLAAVRQPAAAAPANGGTPAGPRFERPAW